MRIFLYQVSYTKYQALFYFWRIGPELKYCEDQNIRIMIVDTCCRAKPEFFGGLEDIVFVKSAVLRVFRRTYYREYLIARYLIYF